LEEWGWAVAVLEKRIPISTGSKMWVTASAVESEAFLLGIAWNGQAIVSASWTRSLMLIANGERILTAVAKATATGRNHRDTVLCLDSCSALHHAAITAWEAENRLDLRPTHRVS
jgi:hypothetical protein